MNMKRWSIVLAALFATSLFVHVVTAADDKDGDKPRARKGRGEGAEGRPKRGEGAEGRPKRGEGAEGRPKRGEGAEGRRRPGGPRPGMGGFMLMRAIDANHDGELSADEIAGASAALKKLDKNNDGKIGKAELQPPRPQRRDGEGAEGKRPKRGDGEGGEGKRPKRGGGEGGGRKRPDTDK